MFGSGFCLRAASASPKPEYLRKSSSPCSAEISCTCATSARCCAAAASCLPLASGTSVFRYTDSSIALAKLPVAACALVTSSRSAAGSASASAITSSVSSVASGLRDSRPSEPNSACRCREPRDREAHRIATTLGSVSAAPPSSCPASSASTRWPNSCTSCRSWVATTTVTPTS